MFFFFFPFLSFSGYQAFFFSFLLPLEFVTSSGFSGFPFLFIFILFLLGLLEIGDTVFFFSPLFLTSSYIIDTSVGFLGTVLSGECIFWFLFPFRPIFPRLFL